MKRIKLSVCCDYKVITIPPFMGNTEIHNCDKCEKACEVNWVEFELYETIAKGIKRPKIEWMKEHGFDPVKLLEQYNNVWS